MAQIVQSYDSGKLARTFDDKPRIVHLDLYVGSINTVVAVGDRVDNQFVPDKRRILGYRHKTRFRAKVGVFLDLRLHKSEALLQHFQHGAFKNFIFDDVHLGSGQCLIAVVANEPDTRPRKKPLRSLAEQ